MEYQWALNFETSLASDFSMNFGISCSFLKPEGKEQVQKQIVNARSEGMTCTEISRALSIPKTTLE